MVQSLNYIGHDSLCSHANCPGHLATAHEIEKYVQVQSRHLKHLLQCIEDFFLKNLLRLVKTHRLLVNILFDLGLIGEFFLEYF